MDTDGDGSFSLEEFTRVVAARVVAANERESDPSSAAPIQAWQDPATAETGAAGELTAEKVSLISDQQNPARQRPPRPRSFSFPS